MALRILKEFADVEPYIDQARLAADTDKAALGFLPPAAYLEQAAQGRLWIALRDGDYVGHLLFGGRYPRLKVFQISVLESERGTGVGSKLVSELISYGEAHSFLMVSARVASDLPANRFWDAMKFRFSEQVPGGRISERKINYRVRLLNSPSLFPDSDSAFLRSDVSPKLVYEDRPTLSSSAFALDVNVVFDVIKQRKHEAAEKLVSASLNNQLRLCVTPEFVAELERHSPPGRADPVLEFSKQLPRLPAISESIIDELEASLRKIVFPHRSKVSARASNDASDLRHLAYCIHHGIAGFITRESAILQARSQLAQRFNVDVISPSDLSDLYDSAQSQFSHIEATYDQQRLIISSIGEADRPRAEAFLRDLVSEASFRAAILEPSIAGRHRRRICFTSNGHIVGIATWTYPTTISPFCDLYIVVNESRPAADRLIENSIEAACRSFPSNLAAVVSLHAPIENEKTREIAIARGFRGTSGLDTLSKVVFNGVCVPKKWQDVVSVFDKLGVTISNKVPSFDEFENTGIRAKSSQGAATFITLFEFETLISPGLVVCPGREAVIVPIRDRFASELLKSCMTQLSLFQSGQESLLFAEKAYFRSTLRHKMFKRGRHVVFYVSGSSGGSMEAIAIARITHSTVTSIESATVNYARQGVLSVVELQSHADEKGQLHAFTFDNVNAFKNPISFSDLKALGCVGPANLVTCEAISANQYQKVIAKGTGVSA